MFKFTSIEESELQAYLAKIRRIAKMDDADALAEVDELIFNLAQRGLANSELNETEVDDYEEEEKEEQRRYFKENLKDFRRQMKEYRRKLQSGDVSEWDVQAIKRDAEQLIDDADDVGVRAEFSKDLTDIQRESEILSGELEVAWATNVIEDARHRDIHNVSSIKSILKSIDTARKLLEQHGGMSIGLEDLAIEARTRCAWYRANKKLLEAEVARKSENITKAYKLELEAQAMLEQDWREIFGNAECPNIESAK